MKFLVEEGYVWQRPELYTNVNSYKVRQLIQFLSQFIFSCWNTAKIGGSRELAAVDGKRTHAMPLLAFCI